VLLSCVCVDTGFSLSLFLSYFLSSFLFFKVR